MADASSKSLERPSSLLNYAHQPEKSPYQASHAIFVREHAEQAEIAINDVPEVIRSRLIFVRLFDINHMMVDAEVVAGSTCVVGDLGAKRLPASTGPIIAVHSPSQCEARLLCGVCPQG